MAESELREGQMVRVWAATVERLKLHALRGVVGRVVRSSEVGDEPPPGMGPLRPGVSCPGEADPLYWVRFDLPAVARPPACYPPMLGPPYFAATFHLSELEELLGPTEGELLMGAGP